MLPEQTHLFPTHLANLWQHSSSWHSNCFFKQTPEWQKHDFLFLLFAIKRNCNDTYWKDTHTFITATQHTCICNLCIVHTFRFLQVYYRSLHIAHEDKDSENQSDLCKALICYNPDSRYRTDLLTLCILIPHKHLMQTWENNMIYRVFSYFRLNPTNFERNLKLLTV